MAEKLVSALCLIKGLRKLHHWVWTGTEGMVTESIHFTLNFMLSKSCFFLTKYSMSTGTDMADVEDGLSWFQ